jgi:hypothetical protein
MPSEADDDHPGLESLLIDLALVVSSTNWTRGDEDCGVGTPGGFATRQLPGDVMDEQSTVDRSE